MLRNATRGHKREPSSIGLNSFLLLTNGGLLSRRLTLGNLVSASTQYIFNICKVPWLNDKAPQMFLLYIDTEILPPLLRNDKQLARDVSDAANPPSVSCAIIRKERWVIFGHELCLQLPCCGKEAFPWIRLKSPIFVLWAAEKCSRL